MNYILECVYIYIYTHMHVCIYTSNSNSQCEQGILNILPL